MTRPDELLSEFIDAWNAGRRPRIREFAARLPPGGEREELARQIGRWLELAPTPAYDAPARAAIRAEPVVQRVLATAGDGGGAWPDVLPRLRAHAGLGLGEVAGRLVERLGLGGVPEARRAEAYLGRMEDGRLGPDRVSRRLLDALGELLGASGASLAALGGRTAGMPRAAPAGGTLFRAEEDAGRRLARDIEVLSRAAMAPAPPPMDELDRLFCGGPDA